MKQLYTVVITILLMFSSTFSPISAQISTPIGLGWMNENACSIYDSENYFVIEDLDNLPCIQVCLGSESLFWLTGVDPDWVITWTIIGGEIISQPSFDSIWVYWHDLNPPAGVNVVINAGDTVYEFGICVDVIDRPKAYFSVKPDTDDLVYCLEQDIFFENLSTPNPGGQITAYHWDFGDGNTSNQFEPSHRYGSPGVYEVYLTVRNECYCMDTYVLKVTIEEMGEPVEISCPTVTCENAVETYTANADCEFYWSVEGGTILNNTENSPVVEVLWDKVDDTGFGWVTLELLGCDVCPVPSVVKVPVIKEKGHVTGDDTICNGQQYRYSLPRWPTTEIQWSLIDAGGTDWSQYLVFVHQRNEIIVSPIGVPHGAYTLRAVYFNTLRNCSGMAEKEIRILDAPHIILGPNDVCAGDSFTFETLVPDPNTEWTIINFHGEMVTIGSGVDFTHTILEPGKYIIIANGPNRCDSPGFIFEVHFSPTPQGIFILPEDVCPNIVYEISFQNTDPNLNLNNYYLEWHVENGSLNGPGNDFQIEVIFDENPIGDYTVSLRYKRRNDPECPSEWLNSGIINPMDVQTEIEPFDPISGNTINTNTFCTSSQVHFRVDELDGDFYDWKFLNPNFGSIVEGQGTNEIVVNLHEISQSQITNPLTLKVQICGIWFDVDPFIVEKTGAPLINWNPPTQICTGESFNVDFSANIGSQPLSSFNQAILDFGNGQTFNTYVQTGPSQWAFQNVAFNPIFTGSVTHNITLTLVGPDSCTQNAFANHQITVLPTPVATISANLPTVTYCEESDIPAGLVLTATETGGIVNVSNWEWYRNGTQVGTGVTFPVTQFGSYRVKALNANNNCDGLSSPYTISQMTCGPGSVCNESIEITNTQWTQCDKVEVSFNYSTPPNQIFWTTEPSTGLDYVQTVGTVAEFVVSLPGAYTVKATATWNCGSKRDSEIVLVAYQARLDYSITCNILFGGYNVTLYNDSPYVSGYQPDETTFFINGATHYFPQHENQFTTLLAPGNYTFQLEIGLTGYPSCTSNSIMVDLISPTSNFNIPAEVCIGEPFLLAPTNSVPGNSYLWEFNGTTDIREQLEITLDENSPSTISLVVTDPWGCSAEQTKTIVVYPPIYEGNIIGHEDPVCQGETVTLSFDSQGAFLNVTYQWLFNGIEIPTETNPTLQAGISGHYGLELTDLNGCSRRINPVPVIIVPLPYVSINGPNSPICAGKSFSLKGKVEDEAIARRWLRDNIEIHPLGTTTPWELNELVENTPGNYTYTLEVGDPANGDCTNSIDYIVHVFPSPTVNDVQLDFQVNCNPFEVVATIINPDPNGTYNWGNGTSGTQTIVNHTGMLAVRYTNEWGCSVWVSNLIPALPEEHIWVFPTGCFEACEEYNLIPSYVIGPIPEYDTYSWLWDGFGNQYGGTQVPPQPIDQEGALQLELGTDILGTFCELTSGTLHVTYNHEGCRPCDRDFELDIEEIRIGQSFPYFYYDVFLNIHNNHGITLTFQFTSPDGVYIPNNVTLGPGQSVGLHLQFIPNAGFTGGNSVMFIQLLHNGELFCNQYEEIEYPGLSPFSITENHQELRLVPNPVTQAVNVHYTLNKSNKGTLTVYSLLGVAIIEQPINQNSGMIPLDLGNLSSGTYIVIINDDTGQRMQQVLIKK